MTVTGEIPSPDRGGRGVAGAVMLCVLGWLILTGVYATLLYAQSFGAMGALLSARVAFTTTFAPAVMGVAG